jgi:kinesin family protein 1
VLCQGSLDPGVFSLHQGLQRRIALVLSSDSGPQLPWTDVTRIRLGNVRLLDPKGRQHNSTSKAMVTLPLLADQSVAFRPDGTGILSAEALWDSSIHDSLLLNRVTASAHRVILQVAWSVAVDTCNEPVQFSMDIAVAIQTRDARPPSRLLTFLSSGKVTSRISSIFNLRLSPPLTRSPQDLWRLDTSEKYVRGEELLSTWKPRGISVVEDYKRLVLTERRAADVQAVRVLSASSSLPACPDSGAAVWGSEALLRKALGLWQKRFGHAGEVSWFNLNLHNLTSVIPRSF